jgi:hypothetical protein
MKKEEIQMSSHTLYRWGGAVTIVTAILIAVGGILRYLYLAQQVGDLVTAQRFFSPAYFLAVFAITALYVVQAIRAGRLGFAGYILLMLGVVFQIPAIFTWIAISSGLPWGHDALMYQWWGGVPFLPVGTYLQIIGLIVFGIATARAGVFPRWAGYCLVIAALVDLPVELPMIGNQLMGLWPISLVFLAVGLAWMGWTLWAGKGETAAASQRAATMS